MKLIKFKNPQTMMFESYTKIPDDKIKRMSAPIYSPQGKPPHKFYIQNPTPRILPTGANPPAGLIFNVYSPCYYAQDGLLYSYDPYSGVGFLVKENFTHYSVSGNPWVTINNIWLGNKGIVCEAEMVFSGLGIEHYADFTTTEEVSELNLEYKPVNDLYDLIRVREWLMQ